MVYKTPGVFIEEIPTFPPSVAQVETAIPAFIGYTQLANNDDDRPIDDIDFPYAKRIKSLLEYERFFGKTNPQPVVVNIGANNLPETVTINPVKVSKYRTYYAMQLFFANGGGPCWIISVGKIDGSTETVAKADLEKGLAEVKKLDEPTLILFPDLPGIDGADDATKKTSYHDLLKAALAQCETLGDRFLLCEPFDGTATDGEAAGITEFRTGIGNQALKYGAAYHPHLRTSLNYQLHDANVTFSSGSATMNNRNLADIKALQLALELKATVQPLNQAVQALADDPADIPTAKSEGEKVALAAIQATEAVLASPGVANLDDGVPAEKAKKDAAAAAVAKAKAALVVLQTPGNNLAANTSASDDAFDSVDEAMNQASITSGTMTNILNNFFTNNFENKLAVLLNGQHPTLQPSPAIAGVYATVDRTRGVWKAPANVSLNAVVAPVVKISDRDQESLNVHGTGKSVNAIRSFAGKGTLVWGARTLAGNDNEWRYVNVRRFYNMVEESVKKATEPFVFEPNDANTWVRVRAMIENFLVVQWRAGALAGATPDDAFYVRVGLGTTMTALDILEGRMNVEIGMAVVRPAEFIILKFSHKMAVS